MSHKTDIMYIRIYPNTSVEDDYASDLASAAANWARSIVDNTYVEGYDVDVKYNHPNVDTSDRQTYMQEFKSWFKDYEDYKYDFGSHIGVSNDIFGGLANAGGSPFEDTTVCVSTDRVRTSIHEMGHNFTSNNDVVRNLTDGEGDHALGKIWTDIDEYSIMAYKKDHTENGSCDEDWYDVPHGGRHTDCLEVGISGTCVYDGDC